MNAENRRLKHKMICFDSHTFVSRSILVLGLEVSSIRGQGAIYQSWLIIACRKIRRKFLLSIPTNLKKLIIVGSANNCA